MFKNWQTCKKNRNPLRGFRAGAKNGGHPLTLSVALTTGQHCHAACDCEVHGKFMVPIHCHTVLEKHRTKRFSSVTNHWLEN